MNTRKAEEKDYEELMHLYNDFVGEDRYSRHDGDSYRQVLQSPTNVAYVVEEEGKIIGFITASIRNVVRYPRPIMEIDELYVVQEFRKQGIGKQLVEFIEHLAKEKNCCRVYIASHARFETAHKFYEGLGYNKYGLHFYKDL